jgi:predicted secreted protein
MKNNLLIWLLVLVVIISGGLVFYFNQDKIIKNSFSSTVSINESNDQQDIILNPGQKLVVNLIDPGDGGYVFADPAYNKDIIKLDGYQNASATSGLIGDFGHDIWTFGGNQKGTTDLQYEVYRPWLPNERLPKLLVHIVVK